MHMWEVFAPPHRNNIKLFREIPIIGADGRMNKEKFLNYSLFIMWFVHLHSFTVDVSFKKQ